MLMECSFLNIRNQSDTRMDICIFLGTPSDGSTSNRQLETSLWRVRVY